MKKIIALLLLFVTLVCISGCNYQMFDTHYSYKYVHVYSEDKCYEITEWTDYEGEQLQVTIIDDGVVLISSINCALIEKKCPFCDHEN